MILDLLQRRILFVGGKGGVGKTTTAAALGLLAADRGQRCLLVSTDPAHSLGDIFAQSIGDQEVLLASGLWGLEIDPDRAAEHYIATVKENLRGLVSPAMYSEIHRQMDLARLAPGTLEAALLERVAELMVTAQEHYDLVIFDTAPTGHTLRLLTLPEIMAAWTDGMLKHQQYSQKLGAVLARMGKSHREAEDLSNLGSKEPADNPRDAQIREILLTRRRKFHRARRLMLDTHKTAFVLVLIPEKLPILESKKALDVLQRFKVPVAAAVINRILPENVDGAFLQTRRHQEVAYLAEIDSTFASLRRYRLPLLVHDVQGLATLREIGACLSNSAFNG